MTAHSTTLQSMTSYRLSIYSVDSMCQLFWYGDHVYTLLVSGDGRSISDMLGTLPMAASTTTRKAATRRVGATLTVLPSPLTSLHR